MDLDQISREGRLPRRDFFRAASVLGIGGILLGGCEKIITIENPIGPEADDPHITLDTYLKDLTGKHGKSNWSILCSYNLNYSNKNGVPVQKTDKNGFTKFILPLEAGDVSARFAMAITETPEGIGWNDSGFPDYVKGWSPEWMLDKGVFRYVFVSIKEPYMGWSLVKNG